MACGNGFDLLQDLRGHFDQEIDWCPQWRSQSDPEVVYPDPFMDPRLAGGWHFPTMLEAESSMSDAARHVAYLDTEVRQFRRRPMGQLFRQHLEAGYLRGLLQSARHLFILMHNREINVRQDRPAVAHDVVERLLFAHHAQIFTSRLVFLIEAFDESVDIPSETLFSQLPVDWYASFLRTRGLVY